MACPYRLQEPYKASQRVLERVRVKVCHSHQLVPVKALELERAQGPELVLGYPNRLPRSLERARRPVSR